MVEQAALLDTRLDPRTIAMTIGVACAAGAIFGVAPALHATSSPAVTALRADSGALAVDQGGGRLRVFLVGGQVALATVLLLGTGLLVASLTRALEGNLGATVKQVAVVSMELPGRFHDEARGIRYRDAVLGRVLKTTGAVRVGWASALPLDRARRNRFRLVGASADVTDSRDFDVNLVTPEYFDVLSLRLIEGRLLEHGDTALSASVAVVDEILARRHFGAAAIGKHLIDAKGDVLEIVGVVQSGRYRTLQQTPQPTIYLPASQKYLWVGHVLVRTSTPPEALLPRLREAASGAGEGGSVIGVATLDARLAEALTVDRLATTLVGACGLVALVMSSLGVYGIMMDAVHRRTREIGLRVALGAGPRQVARLVLLEAAYPAAAGLAAGAVAALAMARAAQALIHGVTPAGLGALAAAAGVLTSVILFAAIVPLQRALRVHPNIALRAE